MSNFIGPGSKVKWHVGPFYGVPGDFVVIHHDCGPAGAGEVWFWWQRGGRGL